MDNRKFEKLIDLIINENEEQARALFHDIVVEKSREIYESMMEDDMVDGMADEGKKFGGQVGEMMDEIGVEEEGMYEEEEELEFDDSDDGEDEMMDIDLDDEGDDEESEDLEDRVVDLEDKLDQLMAEFEEIMAGEEGEEHMGDDDMDGDMSDDEDMGDDEDMSEDDMAMMEAIQLQQMKGLYGSKIGGDNGSQPKSTYADNSGQAGMASRPVRFSSNNEAVPTGPKGPTGYAAKGETSVKGAGSFKNVPAQRKQDLTAAPKPTTTQAAGTNTKSPVAESRRNKRK